ncbi:MAG: protein-disulfide reductase DsbD N-terminal domain-containing protein, partial [Gammaproteobacteria bacterium]
MSQCSRRRRQRKGGHGRRGQTSLAGVLAFWSESWRASWLALVLVTLTFGMSMAVAQTALPLTPGDGSAAARDLLADGEPATPTFLPVDEAFRFAGSVVPAEGAQPTTVRADWDIAPGYYLYRHAFKVAVRPAAAASLADPVIPPGKPKVDA